MYKEYPFEYLIEIGICMDYEYMWEYQGLTKKIASSYVFLLSWCIKNVGNKIQSAVNRKYVKTHHEEWLQ